MRAVYVFTHILKWQNQHHMTSANIECGQQIFQKCVMHKLIGYTYVYVLNAAMNMVRIFSLVLSHLNEIIHHEKDKPDRSLNDPTHLTNILPGVLIPDQ